MTHCNNSNVNLSNSQLNKLKLEKKNGIEVTSNLSWNLLGNSNDEINFLHKFLSTNTKFWRLCKALAYNP